ncbi:MAG: dihydroxy-acid dehydratase [Acidobacteriota bacterium]|nr:MAG: dihydroxy-acid dehydratase [Acidobacteriota bacterium]
MAKKGLGNRLTQYGDEEFALYLRRSFASSMGFSREALGKPIIGILNTYSELNNCHRHLPELVQAVKRGVWQAGGLPLEFPTISLGEVFLSPTSMMYRNLMSMDVETMIKAQPLDGVVLVGGCDKTLPAMLMGAASADLPCIVLAAGPMLANQYQGERVGACTDCRRFWGMFRRGEIDDDEIGVIESRLAPTAGTCGVMGTASTMACAIEALGMMVPGGAAAPAVYAERLRIAEETGVLAMGLVDAGLSPSKIMTTLAFENSLRILSAIGGSTNAIIHLTAVAGRLGINLELEHLDRISSETPVLVDLKPTGEGYMEDFFQDGGVPALMQALGDRLDQGCLTVTRRSIRENLETVRPNRGVRKIIHSIQDPVYSSGALAVLRGNLAPDGAILKCSAATPSLLNGRGRAVVFSSLGDLAERVDDPELDVRPEDFLVLQNAGPVGAPGMPEAGYLPIPKKLKGVKDMVRISDARMSGTAFGTIVLHVSPESAVGGLLGLVRSGDLIELSVDKRSLNLLVEDDELAARKASQEPRSPQPKRGYERLYHRSIQQAHLGADFDFLRKEPEEEP